MKKNYLKPEVEMISLISQEPITATGDTTGDVVGGSMGLEDSIFGDE